MQGPPVRSQRLAWATSPAIVGKQRPQLVPAPVAIATVRRVPPALAISRTTVSGTAWQTHAYISGPPPRDAGGICHMSPG